MPKGFKEKVTAMLKKIEGIALGAKVKQTEKNPPSCELIINNRPTSQRVDGYYLEAAYQCAGGYLVFLNHDCPFEETLSIYLLDGHGTLKDSAHIGGMYTTGYFRDAQITQPDKISFAFFADDTWTVQLLPKPGFRVPLFAEPIGSQRLFGFKRYFVIGRIQHNRPRAPIVLLFEKLCKKMRTKPPI